MAFKRQALCKGCGRCDVPLRSSGELRIHGGIRPADIEMRLIDSPFLMFGVREEGVLGNDLCSECHDWFSLGRRRTFVKDWRVAWPSYVGHALLGECAKWVMEFLPMNLKRQWRFLKMNVAKECWLDEGVGWIEEEAMKITTPMTLKEFQRHADEPFDSKCALCRGSFSCYELKSMALCKFPTCHWNSVPVRKGLLDPCGMEGMKLVLRKPRFPPNFTKP